MNSSQHEEYCDGNLPMPSNHLIPNIKDEPTEGTNDNNTTINNNIEVLNDFKEETDTFSLHGSEYYSSDDTETSSSETNSEFNYGCNIVTKETDNTGNTIAINNNNSNNEGVKPKSRRRRPTSRGPIKKCPFCPKETRFLSSHMYYMHTDPKDIKWHKCDKCDYKGKAKKSLRKHQLYVHFDENETPYRYCSVCEKKFKNSHQLNAHLKRHGPKPMPKLMLCDFYDFSSFSKIGMQGHKMIHVTLAKDLKCTECDFTTRQPQSMKRHKKTHQKWKHCEKCSFKSRNLNALRLHIKMHSIKEEDMNLKCKFCDYKTYRHYNLKIHLLNHKKPEEMEMFHCLHCSFKANRKDNLKTHIFRHDMFKNIKKCPVCGFLTRSLKEFKAHKRTHSSDEIDKQKKKKPNKKVDRSTETSNNKKDSM